MLIRSGDLADHQILGHFLASVVLMALAFVLLFMTLQVATMRNEILRQRVRVLLLVQAARGAIVDRGVNDVLKSGQSEAA